MAAGQLDFRDYGSSLLEQRLNERYFFGNPRTLHDLVRIEDERLRVLLLFPSDVITVKNVFVFLFNCALVRDKDFKSFCLRQYGCSHTAFTSSKNDHTVGHS